MSDRITARRLIAAREERKRQRRMARGLELIGSQPSGMLPSGFDIPFTATLGAPTGRISTGEPDWQRIRSPTTEEAEAMRTAFHKAYPTPEIIGLDFTDAETRILSHDEALERYRK